MKKVFFIMKACILCLGVLFVTFAPLPASADSNNVVVVKAADEAKDRIRLNVNSKQLVKGNSYTLRVYNTEEGQDVSFTSSDSDILTLEVDNGERRCVVTGDKVGTATVTVTVKEGSGFLAKTVKTMTCEVTVGPPAVSIKFIQKVLVLNVKDRVNLAGRLEIKPGNSTEVPTYTVKNSEIGTISAAGYFRGKSAGRTTVTAEIKNGLSVTIMVIVNEEQEAETKED